MRKPEDYNSIRDYARAEFERFCPGMELEERNRLAVAFSKGIHVGLTWQEEGEARRESLKEKQDKKQ